MVQRHVALHGAWGAVDTDVLSASFPWRSAVHFKIARQHFFKHTVRRFFLNPWWQGRWVTGSQVSASDVSLTLLFVCMHLVGRHVVLNKLPSSIFGVVYTDKYVDLVMRFLAKIFDGAVKCSASETASKTLKLHLLTFWIHGGLCFIFRSGMRKWTVFRRASLLLCIDPKS